MKIEIMKTHTYKQELDILLKENGRKKKWLAHKMSIDRVTFWRKVSCDTFTDEQKLKIKKVIEYNPTPVELNLPNL